MVDERLEAIGAGRTDRPDTTGDVVSVRLGRIGSSDQRTAPRVKSSAGGRPEMVVELTGADRRGRSSVQYQAKYTVDDETRRVWIQIVDMERNEVVMEIPPEEVLHMAKELQRYMDQARNHTIQRSAVGG